MTRSDWLEGQAHSSSSKEAYTAPEGANTHNCFNWDHVTSESFWEAAEKVGKKSVILNYPMSYMDWLKEHHKVNVYTLSPEERVRWDNAMPPVHAQWVERMRKQGVENPEGLLEEIRQIQKEVPDPKAKSLRMIELYKEDLGTLYPTDEMMNFR